MAARCSEVLTLSSIQSLSKSPHSVGRCPEQRLIDDCARTAIVMIRKCEEIGRAAVASSVTWNALCFPCRGERKRKCHGSIRERLLFSGKRLSPAVSSAFICGSPAACWKSFAEKWEVTANAAKRCLEKASEDDQLSGEQLRAEEKLQEGIPHQLAFFGLLCCILVFHFAL